MKLASHIVEKPWGSVNLPDGFANPDKIQIGEIWYDDSGQKLPLLVKWLFTSEKLSVQVHPSDEIARHNGLSSGKEECWFIVDAAPDALLGIGTKRPLDDNELRSLSVSGEIEDVIDWKPVKTGDYFYIPAGTVHAIGAGVTLIEVQQNADITYRLYDYGRPRELHLDQAIEAANARPYDDVRCGNILGGGTQKIASSPYFDLHYASADYDHNILRNGRGSWIIPIDGPVKLSDINILVGECAYVRMNDQTVIDSASQYLIAQSI